MLKKLSESLYEQEEGLEALASAVTHGGPEETHPL
jgi:hypothetical protein